MEFVERRRRFEVAEAVRDGLGVAVAGGAALDNAFIATDTMRA